MKNNLLKQAFAGLMGAAMMSASVASAADAAFAPALPSVTNVNDSEPVIICSYDFEDGDASAFTSRGDTDPTVISVNEDNAVSGTHALCASGREKSWNGPSFRLDDKCEAGKTYLVSAQAMGQWYTSLTVSFQYTDEDGVDHYENLASLNGNGWQEVKDLKVSFTSDQTNVCVYFEGGSDNIYVDDFVVKEGPQYKIEEDIPSLKDVYAGYFKFGTAVTAKELAPSSTQDLILKHFNSITLGNELKPENMLDQAGCLANAEAGKEGEVAVKLNGAARTILDFARENDIPVRGHVLVWHSQTPGWFFKEGYSDDGDYVTKEVMLQRMESYIKGVFAVLEEEYSDIDFYAWDVVNEAWLDDGTPRKPGTYEEAPQGNLSGWTAVFGDNSFIPYAFEYARKYAPENTKLYYNDFNEYMPQKVTAIIEMATELKEKGLIDGIGMQSHLDVRTGSDAFPAANIYESALSKYAALGLDIQVTELDATVPKDSGSEYFEQQAQYYSDIMDAIVKYKDSISAVVVWGTTDDQSWRASQLPLLFNEDYTAKECFYSIVDDVEQLETVTTTAPKTTTTTTTTTAADETTVTSVTTAVGDDEIPMNFTDKITDISVDVADIDESGTGNIAAGGTITFENYGSFSFTPFVYSDKLNRVKAGDTVSINCLVYRPDNTIMNIFTLEIISSSEESTLAGDANEDSKVNMADAVFIMQCNANPSEFQLTEQGKVNADVYGNGDGVTNNDALAIQQYEAGLVKELPVTE